MTSETRTQRAGLTKTLATFVHDVTYAGLPENIRELAKNRILDALSAAYCGRDLSHSRTAVEIAKNNPGNATIWGYDLKTTLPYAVMANCVMAHSILQEDFAGGIGHPSTIIIPATLGVAEQERAAGKETLIAIVVGYELMFRLARSITPLAVAAFRGGPIFGTFGAAAATGRLMKLDVNKLSHALGYAASLAPGTPNESWWGGTMEPMFEAGWCARTGIESAIVAKGGATTTPYVLEGKHGFLRCWAGKTDGATFLTSGLGKIFMMQDTMIKPYPACGLNQLPIQAARPLAKHGLKAKDIVKVIEKTGPGTAGSDFAGHFMNQLQAQMSMQFCAAAAMLGRAIDSVFFYAEHYDDPEVGELAKKVELVCERGRAKPRIEVYTHDGRVLIAEEEVVNREPFTPSTEKMEKKIMALASSRLGQKRVRQIIDTIKNLDRISDVRELTAQL